MNSSDEISLLKRCICEFLNKLLPTIKDPSILTRQRMSQFKTVLLDELKTIQDVYTYVQNLQFQQESLTFRTEPKPEHQRQTSGTNLDLQSFNPNSTNLDKLISANTITTTRTIETISTTTQLNNPKPEEQKEIPKLGKDIFFKRPSTRKLSIKTKETKPQDNYFKPMDEIQKMNVCGKKTDNLSRFSVTHKQQIFFDKDALLLEIVEGQKIFRKNTTTLNAVYSRSFEIHTADKEQEQQITSIQQSIRAQQDLRELQNAQRNATLKGYSIYAKKDKDVAKQKMDEIASINDKKKLYF